MDGRLTRLRLIHLRLHARCTVHWLALQFCARICSVVVSGSRGGTLLQHVQRPGCCSFKAFRRRYLWLPVPRWAHEPFLHEAGDQHTAFRPDLRQAATMRLNKLHSS